MELVAAQISLEDAEAIIERHVHSFIEVGNALMRIRDDGLYRQAGFDGFVEYLESKPWGIGANAAYKQIDAARVYTIVQTPNEAQARELAPLTRKATPEVVQQVYAEVVQETNGQPTAAAIREKVQAIVHQPNSTPKKTKQTADYNKHIDEEVIPAAKIIARHKIQDEDWTVFAGNTLRKHLEALQEARDALDILIPQAQAHVGHTPTK